MISIYEFRNIMPVCRDLASAFIPNDNSVTIHLSSDSIDGYGCNVVRRMITAHIKQVYDVLPLSDHFHRTTDKYGRNVLGVIDEMIENTKTVFPGKKIYLIVTGLSIGMIDYFDKFEGIDLHVIHIQNQRSHFMTDKDSDYPANIIIHHNDSIHHVQRYDARNGHRVLYDLVILDPLISVTYQFMNMFALGYDRAYTLPWETDRTDVGKAFQEFGLMMNRFTCNKLVEWYVDEYNRNLPHRTIPNISNLDKYFLWFTTAIESSEMWKWENNVVIAIEHMLLSTNVILIPHQMASLSRLYDVWVADMQNFDRETVTNLMGEEKALQIPDMRVTFLVYPNATKVPNKYILKLFMDKFFTDHPDVDAICIFHDHTFTLYGPNGIL